MRLVYALVEAGALIALRTGDGENGGVGEHLDILDRLKGTGWVRRMSRWGGGPALF